MNNWIDTRPNVEPCTEGHVPDLDDMTLGEGENELTPCEFCGTYMTKAEVDKYFEDNEAEWCVDLQSVTVLALSSDEAKEKALEQIKAGKIRVFTEGVFKL